MTFIYISDNSRLQKIITSIYKYTFAKTDVLICQKSCLFYCALIIISIKLQFDDVVIKKLLTNTIKRNKKTINIIKNINF